MGRVVAVIGINYGDEAKGKLVDYISQEGIDISVRFNGGNNAGHSIETDSGIRHKVHLFPASAFTPDIMCGICNGMAVNVNSLVSEISMIQSVNPDFRFFVDPRAHVVTPYHVFHDREEERARGKEKIGTTQTGNGPAYGDKAARRGITLGDLTLPEKEIMDLIKESLSYKFMKDICHKEGVELKKVVTDLRKNVSLIQDYFEDGTELLNKAIDRGKSVLFAGAHGTLLDIDHGTYPNVTSSSCAIGGIGTGTGVSPRRITEVIGVVKAYSTRVGSGFFPTEMPEEIAHVVREEGKEYGTTTGRPRRIGWIDIPTLDRASHINGCDYIALTLLDVLKVVSAIKIGAAYQNKEGKISYSVPIGRHGSDEISDVVMESFKSWNKDIRGCRRFDDLPKTAQKYVKRVEELLNVPIKLISVGARRGQMIDMRRSHGCQ